jgi:hypothetical protein
MEAFNGNISASFQINQARQAGYSDSEIVNYLAQSRSALTPKIKTAQENNN